MYCTCFNGDTCFYVIPFSKILLFAWLAFLCTASLNLYTSHHFHQQPSIIIVTYLKAFLEVHGFCLLHFKSYLYAIAITAKRGLYVASEHKHFPTQTLAIYVHMPQTPGNE